MIARLRRLACTAALGAGIALSGCSPPPPPPSSSAAADAAPAAFDLEELTIADLQARMQSGQETARSLVDKYLARIAALDASGPAIHSVIEVNPDARAIADALDEERRARGPRGPLHGIPVLLKDNIATDDRLETTAGSLALAGAGAPADAFLVGRLRAAGAVILGKTNLSEWANFRSTHSSSGWSGRGGQTLNPYALDRSPSGSSSGSAAAVAANFAAAAVGTETDGSVVSPSSNASLVGIKPTLGLVSRSGIVPIAHSQDTAGAMARTVADAATLLAVMAGVDAADEATRSAAHHLVADYAGSLDADGLRGARIGVARNAGFGAHPDVDRLMEDAIAELKQRGAILVDPADIPTLGRFDAGEFQVLIHEFKLDLNRYLGALGPSAPIHTLDDLIAFNTAHADEELRYFGQELLVQARDDRTTPARYERTLADNRRLAGAEGIDAVMGRNRLDALIAPTSTPAWLIDHVNGDSVPFAAVSAGGPTSIAAVAGYPHITVPMGYVHGLPVGISFIGRAWSEPTLVKLAYAYEQATHHRRAPTFAASASE